MARGNLILIEGLDRSGKSTQAEILAQRLNAKLFRFPDRLTPIGKLINEYLTNPQSSLSDEAAHLLFSANRWEVANEILLTLQEGTHVMLDRYVYSGVAYSLSKPNLRSKEWLYAPEIGLPKPDLTLFLTIPLEELASRKGWGEERYEKESFQAKVRLNFDLVLQANHDASVLTVDVGRLLIEESTKKLFGIMGERKMTEKLDSPMTYFS